MTNSAWMGEWGWLGGGRGIPPLVLDLKSGLAFLLTWGGSFSMGSKIWVGERLRPDTTASERVVG